VVRIAITAAAFDAIAATLRLGTVAVQMDTGCYSFQQARAWPVGG
jgi:hypothetical protein